MFIRYFLIVFHMLKPLLLVFRRRYRDWPQSRLIVLGRDKTKILFSNRDRDYYTESLGKTENLGQSSNLLLNEEIIREYQLF